MRKIDGMTIAEIKRFQAKLGVMIEVARSMGLDKMDSVLMDAMQMSAHYERLVGHVQMFAESVLPVDDTA